VRQVREVLRLKFVGGVPVRKITRQIGVAASTGRATIRRFQAAGLSWPLPEEMTDAALEAKLFEVTYVTFRNAKGVCYAPSQSGSNLGEYMSRFGRGDAHAQRQCRG
jgi:hypothetical protein